MGLFDFMKGKKSEAAPAPAPEAVTFPAVLGATAKGTFLPMEEVPDPVFSQGILGFCCGIDPEDGNIYAPIGGKITQLADTLHAVGIEAGGIEVLIHVGVDTVAMNGDGFSSKVKIGQIVTKGQLLLTMDVGKVKAAGHPTTVITVVTNSDDFSSVRTVAEGAVQPGDNLFQIDK